MIVCVTGMPAAGKSSVGAVLKGMGFNVYELGDIVRMMMRERGIQINPESDKKFTVWLRKRYGGLVTVKRLAKEVDLGGSGKTAVVGIRSKPELDYIRAHGRSLTVAVLAPSRLRFRRMRRRGRRDAQKTYADFLKRDRKEERWGLWSAIKSADYVIAGTGTLAQLKDEVRQVMKDARRAKAF